MALLESEDDSRVERDDRRHPSATFAGVEFEESNFLAKRDPLLASLANSMKVGPQRPSSAWKSRPAFSPNAASSGSQAKSPTSVDEQLDTIQEPLFFPAVCKEAPETPETSSSSASPVSRQERSASAPSSRKARRQPRSASATKSSAPERRHTSDVAPERVVSSRRGYSVGVVTKTPEDRSARRGTLTDAIKNACLGVGQHLQRQKTRNSCTLNVTSVLPSASIGSTQLTRLRDRSGPTTEFSSWANFSLTKRPAQKISNVLKVEIQRTNRRPETATLRPPPLPTGNVPWRRFVSAPDTIGRMVSDEQTPLVTEEWEREELERLGVVEADGDCLDMSLMSAGAEQIDTLGPGYDAACQAIHVKPNSGLRSVLFNCKPCICNRASADFSSLLLGDRGIIGLLHIIPDMRGLRYLNLAGNGLRDTGLHAVLESLRKPMVVSGLIVLDVSHNPIDTNGADDLTEFLSGNRQLLMLGTAKTMMCSIMRRHLMKEVLCNFIAAAVDIASEALFLSGEDTGFCDIDFRRLAQEAFVSSDPRQRAERGFSKQSSTSSPAECDFSRQCSTSSHADYGFSRQSSISSQGLVGAVHGSEDEKLDAMDVCIMMEDGCGQQAAEERHRVSLSEELEAQLPLAACRCGRCLRRPWRT